MRRGFERADRGVVAARLTDARFDKSTRRLNGRGERRVQDVFEGTVVRTEVLHKGIADER